MSRSSDQPTTGSDSPLQGRVEAPGTDQGSRHRRRLHGRLAGVFFAGSGFLGLITLPLPPAQGSNVAGGAAVSAIAVVVGILIWLAPWEEWPRRASLAILPPAFVLIALGNVFGGTAQQSYGVFFVVAFVWIGIAHPPWTSLAAAPFAAAAYVLPLYFLPGNRTAGMAAAALTIPTCVLVGEALAWGARELGQIELALWHERDITERLRELDDMKNTFMSAVSHELRTPITICRGHLEVLEADPGGIREVADTLVDELERMGRIVDDITTLVRVEDPESVKPEWFQLDKFVSSIATKTGPILGDRLQVHPVPQDFMIRADPHRLTQALLNLLQNAATHGRGSGPVQLRVRGHSTEWLFEVSDEGGGLTPGQEQIAFEPFARGSPSTQGSGLGLAIVRGVAKAHDGTAGVTNRPGTGATFWMRLPR
jgi:signal transduction histidine kinase